MSTERSFATLSRISIAGLVVVTLLGVVGAGFCVVRSEAYATFVGPDLLRIQHAGDPFIVSVHAIGPTIYIYDVRLPYPPNAGRTMYSWRDVRISAIGESEILPATGGSLTIDRDDKSVSVQIQIASTPFMGNGSYRLRLD